MLVVTLKHSHIHRECWSLFQKALTHTYTHKTTHTHWQNRIWEHCSISWIGPSSYRTDACCSRWECTVQTQNRSEEEKEAEAQPFTADRSQLRCSSWYDASKLCKLKKNKRISGKLWEKDGEKIQQIRHRCGDALGDRRRSVSYRHVSLYEAAAAAEVFQWPHQDLHFQSPRHAQQARSRESTGRWVANAAVCHFLACVSYVAACPKTYTCWIACPGTVQ